MEEAKPVVKPPTDFSEFHRQEVMRRLREEQENETEYDRKRKEQERLEQERREAAEEERRKMLDESLEEFYENLSDSDDDDRQLDADGTDVEEVKEMCRKHINKRMEILREGKEEELTDAEFENLSMFDRMRIEYIETHEWDPRETDKEVRKFIRYRIENSPFNDVVIGYKALLKIYDPILGPDFFYLSLYNTSFELVEHERWLLFGY